MFRSLRWRLALSYAGIALLTALAIGAMLIVALRGYYTRIEQDYLARNAMMIGRPVADMLTSGQEPSSVADQLKMLSLLSQSRIQLMDAGSKVLIDTGAPEANIVYRVSNDGGQTWFAAAGGEAGQFNVETAPPGTAGQASALHTFTLLSPSMTTVSGPVEGDQTGPKTAVFLWRRVSDQKASLSLYGEQGQLIGHLELSDGPAYGDTVIASVLRAWVIAGLFGILVAGVSGWLVSRRISKPLLSLTEVTGRMAHGDLATRADIATGDEFETLAHSFNEMAQRVEQTVTALKRFVADAAHELDTPLTALRTNLELILAAPDAGPEHIKEGLAQVRRLETLTHSLLDLSRIEARNEIGGAVDLAALVRRVCEVAASRAEQAGLEFEADISPASLQVQGSEPLLERAVTNLLDNALKFTPSGGTITVRMEDETGRAAITVADTGIGIPEDDLPLLFSRFHRGRNASGYPGNGLGLAIVRAIVENHGGEISAASGPEGASFTIRLPGPEQPDGRIG